MGTHPEEDAGVSRFLRWLEQSGARISKIHIVTPEGAERGVRALADIAPGETLLRIPRSHVLTVEDVRASEIGRLLDDHAQLDEERTYLSAFLLQERERGEDSFWKPFLDMLPTAFPSHPFFFEEHELALLQGSFLAGMVGIQQRLVAERYVHLSQHVPGFNRFTFDAFVWAHFAVVTRTFTMTRSGSHGSCLVPLVDMINDGRPWDSPWAWLEEEQCFQVKSVDAVAAGQELHTTYGNKSNLSLLLQYGYVHEDNAHDEVLLLLGIPPGDPFTAKKQRLLGLSTPDEQRSFKLSRTYDAEVMEPLFAFLRVAQAEAEELAVLETAPDALAHARAPLSQRNEERLRTAFATGCERRLAGYPTSLEEDERLLREETLSPNARNCILLRSGEKKLLHSYAVRARTGFPSFAPG
ncbi:SET domain-containing histone-lysine N-methyltransferase [Hyalangium versicolor]|uniref:SET domain-containing histone-lysine N-methyltransferase n=1 Tax=Hyalangium versicolor TaxID=2861190 RepID=UPI001CC9C054|nr:SET domain-containing histone-lysine N-methyltransferase [Hyalangium versicolor]